MNTITKILILAAAVALAIVGVMMFAKSQIAPPNHIEFENQFIAELSATNDSWMPNMSTSINQHYEKYWHTRNRIETFQAEGYVESAIANDYLIMVDRAWCDRLIAKSFEVFSQSTWNNFNLNAISRFSEELKSIRIGNSSPINSEQAANLNKIATIINDYNYALALTRKTSFVSINTSSERINQAQEYKQKDYLCNNEALVRELTNLRSRLARSHYNVVCAQLRTLENYQSITKEEFEARKRQVINTYLNDYKRTNIYGQDKPSISDEEQYYRDKISEANAYYENLNSRM